MTKEDTPLQYELFSGGLVDNRTATQKKIDRDKQRPAQTEMFAQRELAQFGVRARPQMSLSEHTRLVLIAEDPRTEEEIERDRQRAAEALTQPLFAEPAPSAPVGQPILPMALSYSPPDLPQDEPSPKSENCSDDELIFMFSSVPTRSKSALYQQLVALFQECAATRQSSKPPLLSQRIAQRMLLCEARVAGLTAAEIQAATAIGEYQGRGQRAEHQPSIQLPVCPTTDRLAHHRLITYCGFEQRIAASKI